MPMRCKATHDTGHDTYSCSLPPGHEGEHVDSSRVETEGAHYAWTQPEYHRTSEHGGHTLYVGPNPEQAPEHGFWIVTEDVLSEPTDSFPSRVGVMGPGSHDPSPGVPTDLAGMKADPRAVQWRTYSDDGPEEGITYRGWWVEGTEDESLGCDPLQAFGGPDAGDVNLDVKLAKGADWIGYLG